MVHRQFPTSYSTSVCGNTTKVKVIALSHPHFAKANVSFMIFALKGLSYLPSSLDLVAWILYGRKTKWLHLPWKGSIMFLLIDIKCIHVKWWKSDLNIVLIDYLSSEWPEYQEISLPLRFLYLLWRWLLSLGHVVKRRQPHKVRIIDIVIIIYRWVSLNYEQPYVTKLPLIDTHNDWTIIY